MENNEAPVVEMHPQGEMKNLKPTYEQLEKQVYQLAEKCQEFYGNLQQANMFNTFKRLDYCFKVVENAAQFDKNFVEYCKADIVKIMTIEAENSEETDK